MNDFEQYLALYGIDPMVLLVRAKVRYLTIWNAQKRISFDGKVKKQQHGRTGLD